MAYRNLVIESPAKISCRNEQLRIQTETEHTVPVEDIAAILVESRQTVISGAALSLLAQNGVLVYFCDGKHLPCATLVPFAQHSRQLEVVNAQINLSEPAKKQIWQQIVVSKIGNQAECLALCGKEQDAAYLYSRRPAVKSGDRDNVEATAAAYYFLALFGECFTRGDDEDARNAALNYGYAILRGYMARTLTVYGFLPCMGIHHCSTLNQYNLADDAMEPFRPIVDLFVATHVGEDAMLTPQLKHSLLNLLNMDILSGRQHYSITYAMERMVQSMQARIKTAKGDLLLPTLLPLKMHTYE